MDLSHYRCLVVDDFDNVRKSIKGMLVRLGIENVTEASNGQEALRALRYQSFDVVLCDYNLGPGRDGQQLLELARAEKIISQRTVYVMITAETTRAMVMGALEFEPDDYMAKPFALDTLDKRLQRWATRKNAIEPALAAIENEDFESALAELDKLIEESPRYRNWAQRQKVDILLDQKALDDAKTVLLEAREQREQAWIDFLLARIEFLKGNFHPVIEQLQGLVLRYPNFVKAYDLLSMTYERLDELEQARHASEEGAHISPRSFRRQMRIGELSEQLDDPGGAAKAFRKAVKLAENSPHETPALYDRLLLNLESAAERSAEVADEADFLRDASRVLDKMNKRFKDDPEAVLRSQIHQLRLAAKAARASMTEKLMDAAKRRIGDVSQELLLEVMQAYYDVGQANAANRWADELIKKFPNDKALQSKIIEMQSEPIPEQDKRKASELNRSAVQAYKDGNFELAEDKYQAALQISPHNPSLILNYVQALLQLVLSGNNQQERISAALALLQRLQYLSDLHSQYERYQQLQSKALQIKEKLGA
ncbi:tetratricopeptide repeat-containing response regulator [Salinibius halmophilus]|uniref:tetratricopeptide repeat-containing response regulator n=1 Tax=Salinibius halmophilus TaxID=1853216 RepID=UPI000E6733C9|nr:tetratricopeptide repeat-containing response regulator [Salinibius halmophilus]